MPFRVSTQCSYLGSAAVCASLCGGVDHWHPPTHVPRLMQLRDMLCNAERLVSNKSVFEERIAATMSRHDSLLHDRVRRSVRHASVAHGSWGAAGGGVRHDGEQVRKLNGM